MLQMEFIRFKINRLIIKIHDNGTNSRNLYTISHSVTY